jgi:undecaprenyl-diphosphatase
VEGVQLSILQAIVLGITQGITEFAPVSSSGHLILVPWLFGWSILEDPNLNKTFDVALHMGTLLGAVVFFRRDLWRYLLAWLGSFARRSIGTHDERVAWGLVLGTIPGVIAGAALQGVIEDKLGQPWLIALMFAVFGVVLYLVDRFAPVRRDFGGIGVRDGVAMGVGQSVALQPGVSRSGITMTVGRLLGLDREASARFSFLLSIPIIAGAGLFKGVELVNEGIPPGMGGAFVAGIAASAVSGFLVIWFLLAYLRRHSFAVFMWYRLAVAALVFAVIALGIRPASGL